MLDNQVQQNTPFPSFQENDMFDYSQVIQTARVAVYDDMKMAPRIIEVEGRATQDFIEQLAATINEQRIALGGTIPYAAIREVSENFIHAHFNEMVVSIFDHGNTIRFSDQGPGIPDKDQALRPGFTSANAQMKHYIKGVGSGFPLIKDYLDYSHGHITIEDNMGNGAVVTISLTPESSMHHSPLPVPPLNIRERNALLFMSKEGAVGNKDLSDYLEIPASSANVVLTHLEEYGLIEKTYKKKRILTELGAAIIDQL